VFQFIERVVLVKLSEAVLARGDRELRCWSIGCASGEEPYTLAILWDWGVGRQFPQLSIRILATDADRNMVARAEEGCYSVSSLRELPRPWKDLALNRRGDGYCISSSVRDKVSFLVQDIRRDTPEGRFDFILLRNVAFTYFDQPLQRDILLRVKEKLVPGGALVVGEHESLPVSSGFTGWPGGPGVYQNPTV
jgi:chemotaxis protein methyltransferase CheR